ncbi:carbohydrate-binding domain-containing protein [Micromonospora rifamycinica]|uniref:carbohydrate-binding domain-containing protein n=2 Tax=Micromonospora rifamycinica TaxID=291594 RepID=UPI0033E0455F
MTKKWCYALVAFLAILAPYLLVQPAASAAASTRVMLLGDSITGSNGCWRSLLWQHLQSSGYPNVDFVGTLRNPYCSGTFDVDNEGHGGFLATGIADGNLLPGWLSATRPNVVVMMLGTNDVWSNKGTPAILSAYSKLLAQMRANNPDVKVLVAQILPMAPAGCGNCNANVQSLNAGIPGWAATNSTSRSPVRVVDQYTGFNPAQDTVDGVHPNDTTGIRKIEARFFPALTPLLGTSTPTPPSPTAPNGFPYCTSAASDPDGDGWGWENNRSCVVRGGRADSGTPTPSATAPNGYPYCTSAASDPDGDGWGWENNRSCVVRGSQADH